MQTASGTWAKVGALTALLCVPLGFGCALLGYWAGNSNYLEHQSGIIEVSPDCDQNNCEINWAEKSYLEDYDWLPSGYRPSQPASRSRTPQI
jgi:hypothetical protein